MNYILVTGLALGAGSGWTSCGRQGGGETETCKVRKGELTIDLTEEGEVQATSAVNISSPAMSWRFGPLKITRIVEDGTVVSKGDTVIVFDPSEVLKVIMDAEAELEIARAELEQKQAEQESKIDELKANIETADLSYQIYEIKLEQATFDAEIDRKTIQLNLDKARIALEKAKEEIDNQGKIHHEEIQQSKLKIRQLEANLEEAHVTLRSLTVVSPAPGIAIIRKNWNTRNKWQVGDQPWSGNPLIDLPDLNELKAVAEISEVDVSKIGMGQKVEIRLDAFSDTVFSGKVISIANLAQFKGNDTQIKIFPVEILINDASEKFLPGMTVSCRIIIDRIADVLYVPLESIHAGEEGNFVYCRSGSGFSRKYVTTGIRNNDFIVIEDGLEEGEVVALSDPESGGDKVPGKAPAKARP